MSKKDKEFITGNLIILVLMLILFIGMGTTLEITADYHNISTGAPDYITYEGIGKLIFTLIIGIAILIHFAYLLKYYFNSNKQ